MAKNIVEMLRQNLGYSPLEKIDPNIQETKEKIDPSSLEKLGQASIPTVLAGLYKLTRTAEGCNELIAGKDGEDWLSIIYKGKEKEAVEKVAHYAGVTTSQADSHMENIADESVKLLKEAVGDNPKPDKVEAWMHDQRHHILVYLPAALQMGDLLNDEGLDDRTNKMEGPVSNIMHTIENKFSGGGDT